MSDSAKGSAKEVNGRDESGLTPAQRTWLSHIGQCEAHKIEKRVEKEDGCVVIDLGNVAGIAGETRVCRHNGIGDQMQKLVMLGFWLSYSIAA